MQEGNLTKIEGRTCKEGPWKCGKCQKTLQATDSQSPKGESNAVLDLAPRSNTQRGLPVYFAERSWPREVLLDENI